LFCARRKSSKNPVLRILIWLKSNERIKLLLRRRRIELRARVETELALDADVVFVNRAT
jgi:hypothetical protein